MAVLGVEDDKGEYRKVEESEIVPALLLHQGAEDAPVYEPGNLEGLALNTLDLLEYLDRGYDLFQYKIEWIPEWLAHRRGEHLPEAPEGWISLEHIARINDISERTVKRYCRKHLTSRKCKGGVYYVKPDIEFDYWITGVPGWGALFRRLAFIKEALEHDGPFDGTGELFALLEREEDETTVFEKRGMYASYDPEKFLKRSLQDRFPETIQEWKANIDGLVTWAKNRREVVYQS